jgi:fibronectin type 3 domain-containing protein
VLKKIIFGLVMALLAIEGNAQPSTPTGLTVVAGGSYVTLNWNASSGTVSYYQIQRWVSGSTTTNTMLETAPYTSFSDYNVGIGTNYNYAVSAVGTGGSSTNSNPVSSTPTGAPSPFVHPGCLHILSDFTRMATNVAAQNYPWFNSYQLMTNESEARLSWGGDPQGAITRSSSGGNFARCQDDALAIYYLTLEYRITGNTSFASAAINIMNAWSGTVTNITGDSNYALAGGLCGYEFACAAEELKGYSGWSAASQNAYKEMLVNVFYQANNGFLTGHNGTCDTHYRCNWDACNMASAIAIGVFCDNTNIFNQITTYYTNGIGNGNINNAVDFVHPNGLGQWEESGRDQAHTFDGINCEGIVCQVAWNQGMDLYGYNNNLYLRGLEYVCKYNLTNYVPYVHHQTCDEGYDETVVSSANLAQFPYIWEMQNAHYVNTKGLAAPYTAQVAALLRPDGGITDWNSPDWFGFTSLTFYINPIATNAAAPSPSGLQASVTGTQTTLSWWGTAYATSYNVQRATVSGGPYETLGTVGPNNTYYVDTGLALGTTYYYVISANTPAGITANSAQLAVIPNTLVSGPDDLVSGSMIGTPGSYDNNGTTMVNVFDGSLNNFFDGPDATGDWAGLDLGAGVSSVITNVAYCPRNNYASRMVGGVFQGTMSDPAFTNPVTLFTISAPPALGVMTSQPIKNSTGFRYLRYLGPANGECDVAEVQFEGNTTGLNPPASPTGITATVISSSQIALTWNPVYEASSYDIERSTNSAGPYVILENLPGTNNCENIPGTNYTDYTVNAGTTYYYTVTALNFAGPSTNSSLVGATTPFNPVQLTGTIIGTSGSWDNLGNTITNAFDGNVETFYDAAQATGGWAGLDLGTSNVIAQVAYYPRIGYEYRMTNGIFQGTVADPTFTNPVTLFTVPAIPADAYTYQSITNTSAFRYVRYLGPANGNCDVAELRFYKIAPPTVPFALTASAGDKQAVLDWSAATGASGYNVKWSTISGGPYSTVASGITTTGYTNSSLTNGITYYFVISATNSTAESANSTQTAVQPVSFAPVSLSCLQEGNQLQINWPLDHTGWQLQVQTNSLATGLSTNWVLVPDSSLTNQYLVPAGSVNGGVFYRLIYQ